VCGEFPASLPDEEDKSSFVGLLKVE